MALFPWQQQVRQAQLEGARYIVLKCGRKAGKTEFLRDDFITEVRKAPRVIDQVVPYIAPTRKQAKAIFWRRVKTTFPREELVGKPRESDLTLEMMNGNQASLFGSENEDAIRGLTFPKAYLDEADFMRGGFWEEVVEPNLKVLRGGGVFASTPYNRWFTKLWREAKDGRLGREWAAFHFTIYDNPTIDRAEIESTKKATPTDIWEREYMANENAYGGLQYNEFAAKHIVPHREPPAVGHFCRGLDWGWAHPSICLWANLYYDDQVGRWRLYIYREFQIKGVNCEDLVKPILKIDRERRFIFTVVDGSARRTEMGTGNPILKELARAGLPCRVPPGNDDIRINAAKMMLKQDDVTISENCTSLIRNLRELEWGATVGDDAADAFKYMCSMVFRRDFANVDMGEAGGPKDGYNPMAGPPARGGIREAEEAQDAMAWEEAI